MEIRDVVFEMYKERVENIVKFNVEQNVSRILTMIHMMIVEEAQKLPEENHAPFINILNKMQKTFITGENQEQEQEQEQEINQNITQDQDQDQDQLIDNSTTATAKVLSANFGNKSKS